MANFLPTGKIGSYVRINGKTIRVTKKNQAEIKSYLKNREIERKTETKLRAEQNRINREKRKLAIRMANKLDNLTNLPYDKSRRLSINAERQQRLDNLKNGQAAQAVRDINNISTQILQTINSIDKKYIKDFIKAKIKSLSITDDLKLEDFYVYNYDEIVSSTTNYYKKIKETIGYIKELLYEEYKNSSLDEQEDLRKVLKDFEELGMNLQNLSTEFQTKIKEIEEIEEPPLPDINLKDLENKGGRY